MCGIVGFFIKENINEAKLRSHLSVMTNSLSHRGPDDKGVFFDKEYFLGFGHTRLSIQDLTKNGTQPMFSHSKRLVIVFNGEIYNHFQIRKLLNNDFNINWVSRSDTETLLICIERYGIAKTLKIVNGMFAFSIFDRKLNKLYLARDKFGEKPLYYTIKNKNFFFGSEIFAIEKFQDLNLEINKHSLNLYSKYQYIPNPHSVYKNTYKLQPGSYLEIDVKKFNSYDDMNIIKWYDLKKVILNSKNKISSEKDLSLKTILQNSVRSQLISDVPVGCFLSGGIDSSLITSIMAEISTSKINTFTIGLKDRNFDESIFSKEIAKHLGTNHHEYLLSEKEVSDRVINIINDYDEPFADSSQIPTNLISQFAKKEVSVVLTGDGGDELFGGYNRYLWSKKLIIVMKLIPYKIRKIIGKLLLLNPNLAKKVINMLFNKTNNPYSKIEKISSKLVNLKSEDDIYYNLVTEWKDHENLFDKKYIFNLEKFEKIEKLNNIENMMYFDSLSYLTDDILYKVDRSSMRHGLECRAPYLDDDVVKKAWQIPFSKKINNSKNGKIILQNLLSEYIPKKMFDRPKMGFSIPLAKWIRGELKDFVYESISSNNFKNFDLINHKVANKYLEEHISNKRNWEHKIWSLVVLSNWLQKRNFI